MEIFSQLVPAVLCGPASQLLLGKVAAFQLPARDDVRVPSGCLSDTEYHAGSSQQTSHYGGVYPVQGAHHEEPDERGCLRAQL